MENAKTLILNDNKNPNFKAILNLKNYENCAIKFFNIKNENKNYALGIKQRHSVIKVPLTLSQGKAEFLLPKGINLEENLLCAVVDVSNAFCPEIVLSGSLNDALENTKIEQAFVQVKPKDVSTLYVEDEEEQIEKLIDKNLEEDNNTIYYDNCSTCKYRKAFYEGGECICCGSKEALGVQENITEDKKNEESQSIKNNEEESSLKENKIEENFEKQGTFYNQIKEQIDILFSKYEKDLLLERIIPNSKWVRVDYNNNNEFYVLGLVYENGENPTYISYGIPSKDSNNPPEDLKDFAQWLPIDFNNPLNEGYWIVYQDANSGKTLKIDFV